TAPRGAATRPYRPCPSARTRPGSRPCSEPNSSLVEAAQGPRDQVVADCPSHQHARPAPSTDPWWWPREGLLPRPQPNDSVLPPASPEADTEGAGLQRRVRDHSWGAIPGFGPVGPAARWPDA